MKTIFILLHYALRIMQSLQNKVHANKSKKIKYLFLDFVVIHSLELSMNTLFNEHKLKFAFSFNSVLKILLLLSNLRLSLQIFISF